jgi:CHAT domain-containing protein/Tfp pilus assembly protein PilF
MKNIRFKILKILVIKALLIFYFFPFIVFSQDSTTNEIKLQITNYQKSGNTESVDYANLLNNLGLVYYDVGDYEKAEPLLISALKIKKKKLGNKHLEYANTMNNLALLYLEVGKYDAAEPLLLSALKINEKNLGKKHPNYANSVNSLAMLYHNKGLCSKAEQLYLEALEIRKEILSEDSKEYALSLNNLGTFYYSQGKYVETEKYLLNALDILKKNFGEKHSDYIKLSNNLASFYNEQNKFAEAEATYLKSLSIIKEVFGENSIDYATSLNNLASNYQDQGYFEKAEFFYLKSKEIRKKILGENHPDYLNSLNNLATLYLKQSRYNEADTLYLKALEIRKATVGENHPDYANFLNNLACFYIEMSKYKEAELLLLKSLEIRKSTLGENHPDYALALANIGGLYLKLKKYSEAESSLLKSLEIREHILGKNHPEYISNLYELADCYESVDKDDKSSLYFEQAIRLNQKRMLNDVYGLSEKKLVGYLKSNINFLNGALSFLNNYTNEHPEINKACFENELLFKNLSLRNLELIKRLIQKSNNEVLKEKFSNFLFNKIEIEKQELLTLEKRNKNLDSLIAVTEVLEQNLLKISSSFINYQEKMAVSFDDIKRKLKKDEIAIDFFRFIYDAINKKSIHNINASFVVKKAYNYPMYTALFDRDNLYFITAGSVKIEDSLEINEQYSTNRIKDFFIKPLEKELEGISTIYLSPSGLGHQINFAALPVSATQTLGEKYQVHILNSPAEIIDYKPTSINKKDNIELLLYGGIDYNKSNSVASKETAEKDTSSFKEIAELAKRSGIASFGYLNGTNKEVEQIKVKGIQNGFATSIIKERDATEESIKKLDGKTSPYILHLATHGFFFPDPKEDAAADMFLQQGKSKVYKTSDNPMMRSGFLMAGANNFWGKVNINSNIEDGILTASEISNLDLSACQLVVLSACETGLGEINGSEGVFGLQRAFKMAGVKNIIMSLWKVPDIQTAELFDIFYSECFSGKTIHQAFQTAQSKMKAKYSPYYWAGFVLLE